MAEEAWQRPGDVDCRGGVACELFGDESCDLLVASTRESRVSRVTPATDLLFAWVTGGPFFVKMERAGRGMVTTLVVSLLYTESPAEV